MYSNYGITLNTKMKIKNITNLLIKAYDQEQENSLLRMWELQFPNMDKETYISFEDYKKKLLKKDNYSEISYEEIEEEMKKVEKAFAERGD